VGDVIFAKTRHTYDSYTDFWKLVELAGYHQCYVDEIDTSTDNTYIVSPINGEYRPHIDNQKEERKAKLIWWNLERGTEDFSDYSDEIWASDRAFATASGATFVPVGSNRALKPNQEVKSSLYDYCHLSYVSHRRDNIYGNLTKRGLTQGPNSWGDERHRVLLQSRFLLNVHQDGQNTIEPLRFALACAYGIPILSEECDDPYPYHDVATFVPYSKLVQRAVDFIGTASFIPVDFKEEVDKVL